MAYTARYSIGKEFSIVVEGLLHELWNSIPSEVEFFRLVTLSRANLWFIFGGLAFLGFGYLLGGAGGLLLLGLIAVIVYEVYDISKGG